MRDPDHGGARLDAMDPKWPRGLVFVQRPAQDCLFHFRLEGVKQVLAMVGKVLHADVVALADAQIALDSYQFEIFGDRKSTQIEHHMMIGTKTKYVVPGIRTIMRFS
jgi:hypothetical protein